jgi:hypothetical protein
MSATIDPFQAAPDPALYVPRRASERAVAEFERGLFQTLEAVVVLVGPPGIGKSVVLAEVARRLDGRCTCVTVEFANLPLPELCKWVLRELEAGARAEKDADTSRLVSDVKNCLGGAQARAARAKTGVDLAQIAAHCRRLCGIGQHPKRLVGDTLRREIVLDQLRHDAPPGDQICHRIRADVHEWFAEAIGKSREPIDDDHRTFMERGLDGHGARRHQGYIRRCKHIVGAPFYNRHRSRKTIEWREQRIVEMWSARNNELNVAEPLPDEGRSADQIQQNCVDLIATTSGEKRDDRPGGIKSAATQELRAWSRRRRDVEQRVPDPLHRNAGVAIDRFFKREDHEHAIGNPPHRLHSAATPGPQLWTDVVDDGHAQFTHRAREYEVEVRKVDGDEHIGSMCFRVANERAIGGIRARQKAGNFEKTGDRQSAEVRREPSAGVTKPATTESHDRGAGLEAKKLVGERAGVKIAGRLAARDHHAHG